MKRAWTYFIGISKLRKTSVDNNIFSIIYEISSFFQKKMRYFFALQIFFLNSAYASGNDARLGAQLGSSSWGGMLVHFTYDQKGLLPIKNSTLGGELSILGNNMFIISARALSWQRASSLSGYYIGPKISLGLVKPSHFNQPSDEYLSPLFVGMGGEAGFLYRFINKVDIGIYANLQATNLGMWIGYGASVGYLIR